MKKGTNDMAAAVVEVRVRRAWMASLVPLIYRLLEHRHIGTANWLAGLVNDVIRIEYRTSGGQWKSTSRIDADGTGVASCG